jgi:phenylacetate-CoA ligase
MRPSEAVRCARWTLWLARTHRWRSDRIRRYQEAALRRMLEHALATVPYYRGLGLDRSPAGGAEALGAFPVLTKALVQEHSDNLLSRSYARGRLHVSRSSGSTGQPTSTWFDVDAWALTKHALKLRRTLSGIERPPYRVLIVGEEPASATLGLHRPLAGVCRVSIHDSVEEHLDAVMRFRPTGIYAAPSWLVELAEAAQRRGITPPPPRAIWSSSEVLTPAAREAIGHAFRCGVTDVYGSSEFKEVAVECSHGRLHVNFESSYVEIQRNARNDLGSILITSLVNRAMPLIRYKIGDLGRLTDGDCPCGSSVPWLERLAGREVDLIDLPNGRRISPYLLSTIIESDRAIARYQLRQLSPHGVEVCYRLRPGAPDLDCSRLERRLGDAVGGLLSFSLARVERLEATTAGKHRILIRAPEQ